MKKLPKILATLLLFAIASACGGRANESESSLPLPVEKVGTPEPVKTQIPITQIEILDDEGSTTDSPLGQFDFKNYKYPFPHGWQDPDSKEITLRNGVRRMTVEKIGMRYLTSKFGDVTGDGEDEAFVILQVATGGSAIPLIVYIFQWDGQRPQLIWYFRTGDRADGGLKRIYPEDGALILELFGKDRYIFSQMETSKIVGDDQQLCCPTHFTRSRYERQGKGFVLKGDRLTFSLKDTDAPPMKNLNETKLKEERDSRK